MVVSQQINWFLIVFSEQGLRDSEPGHPSYF